MSTAARSFESTGRNFFQSPYTLRSIEKEKTKDYYLKMNDQHLKLLSSFNAGSLNLSHRVVLAPMTRLRADPGDSPSAIMVEYYRQRASKGGLLITESAHPSYDSRGYIGAPGIDTDQHVGAW